MTVAVPPDAAADAVRWQAEEAAVGARVEAQVAAFQAAAEPPPPPGADDEARAAGVLLVQLPRLCGVAWLVIDGLVQRFAGEELALTAAEHRELAAATEVLARARLPALLSRFGDTPEGAFVATVGFIYGAKLLAPAAPPPAPEVQA